MNSQYFRFTHIDSSKPKTKRVYFLDVVCYSARLALNKLRAISIVVCVSCTTNLQAAPSSSTDIETLLPAIQIAVEKSAKDLCKYGVALNKVDVSLKTVLEKSGDGKLKIFFFELGGEASKSITNTVSLDLRPKNELVVIKIAERDFEVAESLVASIKNVAQRLSDLKLPDAKLVPLRLKTVTAEIGFVVQKTAKGGVGFDFSLIPVTIGMSGKLKSTDQHKLSVTYERFQDAPAYCQS